MQDEVLNTIIDQLKTLVYYDVNGEQCFNEEYALAILLLSDAVFLNDHWWKKEDGWPEDACKTSSLNVNTSDVLAWGCADAEGITWKELQDVYEYWLKDPADGTVIWFCKKVNMMPQKPVADAIRKAGIWDIDAMGLEPNPTDKHFDQDEKRP